MLNQATKGNKFKVSRFYIELIGAAKTSYAATVWHKFIVPKHKFIFWQIINEQLLTQDLLSRFLPIPSELWAVCEDASETHSHLFMDCIFTRKLIDWVKNWADIVVLDLYNNCRNRLCYNHLNYIIITASAINIDTTSPPYKFLRERKGRRRRETTTATLMDVAVAQGSLWLRCGLNLKMAPIAIDGCEALREN
ncbi:hypothetical protein F8388_001474 [Cannabis sativa]|uniref:Reverse transcriptase zinc-binding domain-containing protein n=1 Tax=Cannabis sativa TaxID=3483 RepID=A0A7J6GMS9_CANSA|nr:hypothetical protein F8388_001474 [Cannabis sativa]